MSSQVMTPHIFSRTPISQTAISAAIKYSVTTFRTSYLVNSTGYLNSITFTLSFKRTNGMVENVYVWMMLNKEYGMTLTQQDGLNVTVNHLIRSKIDDCTVYTKLLDELLIPEKQQLLFQGIVCISNFSIYTSNGQLVQGNLPKVVQSNLGDQRFIKNFEQIVPNMVTNDERLLKLLSGLQVVLRDSEKEDDITMTELQDISSVNMQPLYMNRLATLQTSYDLDQGYRVGYDMLKLMNTFHTIFNDIIPDNRATVNSEEHVEICKRIRHFYYGIVCFVNDTSKFVYTRRGVDGSCERVEVSQSTEESRMRLETVYVCMLPKGPKGKKQKTIISLYDILLKDMSGMHVFDTTCVIPYRIDKELTGLQEKGLLNLYVPCPYIPGGSEEYEDLVTDLMDSVNPDVSCVEQIYKRKFESLGFENDTEDLSLEELVSLIEFAESHFRDIVCNGHEDRFTYLINFLLYPFTHPGEKTNMMLIISGQLGSGKSIIFEPIMRMLNQDKMLAGEHIGGFFEGSKFNYPLYGKLFVLWEEVNYPKGSLPAIKNAITAQKQMYHKKGQTPFMAPCPTSYIGLTNKKYILPIDKGSRRFVFFEVENLLALNDTLKKEYFDKLLRVYNSDFLFWLMMDHLFIEHVNETSQFDFTKIPQSTIDSTKNQRLNAKLIDAESIIVEFTQNVCNYVSPPHTSEFEDIDKVPEREGFYERNTMNNNQQSLYIHAYKDITKVDFRKLDDTNIINNQPRPKSQVLEKRYRTPTKIEWYRKQIVESRYEGFLRKKSRSEVEKLLCNMANFYNNQTELPIFSYHREMLTDGNQTKSYIVIEWPRYEESYIVCYKTYGQVYHLPSISTIYPHVRGTTAVQNGTTYYPPKETTFTWNQFLYWYECFGKIYFSCKDKPRILKVLFVDFFCDSYPLPHEGTLQSKIESIRNEFDTASWFEIFYEPEDIYIDNFGEKKQITRNEFFEELE